MMAIEVFRMQIGVAVEYIAGHVTFVETLRAIGLERDDLSITVLPLHFPPDGICERLPPFRDNWSLRASLRARRRLGRICTNEDALLIHTQTAALLSVGLMRRVPTVISTDVTPIGYDIVGGPHGHFRGHDLPEELKRRVVKRAFNEATAIVAWSHWTRDSLIRDYGVDPNRIHLIPAGVRVPPPEVRRAHDRPVRLLFVARNFEAKGGNELLAALDQLEGWELDIVTHSPVEPRPCMHVHNGLTPGSPRLLELYSLADAFVLPTKSDASPFAVLEGMAAGLPVVTTQVGAIGEIVVEGTGLLTPPGDVNALRAALARVLTDSDLRRRLGEAARARVLDCYRAEDNANRVLDLLVSVGESPRGRRRPGGARDEGLAPFRAQRKRGQAETDLDAEVHQS
jgi:glycosyltransferase involved in cell wall biosynthesis